MNFRIGRQTGKTVDGHEVGELKGKDGEPVVVPPSELASRIGAFVRFRWGELYFTTNNRQRSTPILLDESVAASLSTLFAMRFVDGHLLFVYTPDAEHRDALVSHFPIAER